MTGERSASVHLTLRGRLDDETVTLLRQQLAACLASGVSDIRVRIDEQVDVDLRVLQVLQGAGDHLAGRGGSLVVTGAQPRVLSRIRIHGLERLLPPGDEAAAAIPSAASIADPHPDLLPPAGRHVPLSTS